MREIVGVVGNAKQSILRPEADPIYYFPYRQMPWCCPSVLVRGVAAPLRLEPAMRSTVASMDKQLPVFNVRTFDRILDTSVAQPRVTAWLVGMFGGLALLLAGIGVYGVLAYLVTQRTREIGVRLALGAAPSSVRRLVVGHSLRLSLTGIGLGAVGAVLAGPTLQSQLFGVQPRDPITLAAVAATLLGIALLASYLPARRATRVDPLTALRTE